METCSVPVESLPDWEACHNHATVFGLAQVELEYGEESGAQGVTYLFHPSAFDVPHWEVLGSCVRKKSDETVQACPLDGGQEARADARGLAAAILAVLEEPGLSPTAGAADATWLHAEGRAARGEGVGGPLGMNAVSSAGFTGSSVSRLSEGVGQAVAMLTQTPTGWETYPDEVLLDALTQRNLQALLELHRRYAPCLYALARREQVLDPERRVQDAWLFILRRAHCSARTPLDTRQWLLVMGHRALTTANPTD